MVRENYFVVDKRVRIAKSSWGMSWLKWGRGRLAVARALREVRLAGRAWN